MNKFSKIENKSALIDALIEHLQLLKESEFELARIEKDILLQDLRDAYLLLLSFQPVDEMMEEEICKKRRVKEEYGEEAAVEDHTNEVEKLKEVDEFWKDETEEVAEESEELTMPIKEESEESIEELTMHIEELPEELIEEPAMPVTELLEKSALESEEPLEEFEELIEMIEEMKEEPRIDVQDEIDDLEKILKKEKEAEAAPEKKIRFREPELFPMEDFQPRGLFDPIEEEEEVKEEAKEEVKEEAREIKEEVREEEKVREEVKEAKEEVREVREVIEIRGVREVLEVTEIKEVKSVGEVRSEEDVITKLSAESDISELIDFEEKKEVTHSIPKMAPASESTTTAKKSLNDLLNEQKKESSSLNNRFQNAKVNDLTKSISINDKFLFIRELFSNKGEEFSRAVQTLNGCEDMEKAFEYMEELKKLYLWDSDSPAYLSFCDLVRRKF